MSGAMNLSDFIAEQGGTGKIGCPIISTVAKGAECSPATLYMISLGHKQASAKLAGRIERATFGKVSRHELRPDIFGPAPTDRQAA